MYKPLLKATASQRALLEHKGEELKSNEHCECTHLEYVNKHRDFSKIKEKDLGAVFLILKARCPKSWTNKLEIRAKELNRKFMTIKNGSSAMFIDPDRKWVESKTDEPEVHRLMTTPES